MKLPSLRLSISAPKYLSVKCGNNYNDMTVIDRWVWWFLWRNYYGFMSKVNANRHKIDYSWIVEPYASNPVGWAKGYYK